MRLIRLPVNGLSGSDVGHTPQSATDAAADRGEASDRPPGAAPKPSQDANLGQSAPAESKSFAPPPQPAAAREPQEPREPRESQESQESQESREPQESPGRAARLGVLSIHFEGGRCRVNCPFCYLGKRAGTALPPPLGETGDGAFEALVAAAIAELSYSEVAVALSEPVEPVLPVLLRLAEAAARRGRPMALTTTIAVAMALPAAVLSRFARLNLSVDPFKGQLAGPAGQVAAAEVQAVLAAVRARARLEHVLIVTLSTPRFAQQLWGGLLGELLALDGVDRVALNALKPPPPWCDRAFWLQALHRIRPLLREHLDRRLFLDCYVAARILGLGGCPARPDLSPASAEESRLVKLGRGATPSGAAVAFRSCVYQPAADFVVRSSADLQHRLHDFTAPATCPFPID